jgi:AraC-like DNA-binding protein
LDKSRARLKDSGQVRFSAGHVTSTSIVESVACTTDSPAAFAAELGRFWSGKAVVPRERHRAGYELTAFCSRAMSVGRISSRAGWTSRASVAHPMLKVPLDCSADFRVGRTRVTIRRGEAIMLSPGHAYTADLSAGSALFLQVDAAVLTGGLPAGRAGRSRHWALRCVPIDFSGSSAHDLLAEVDSLLRTPESPAPYDRFAEFAGLERRVVSWLTGSLLDRGGLKPSTPAASELAERAGAWIDSNLPGPISLESLAGRFGVTGRWLQKCFLARWGLTPMDYVAARRLELARSCLMSPERPSVTSAAIRCGFGHLGRFAGLYRETYGESPSETAARAAMERQRSGGGH